MPVADEWSDLVWYLLIAGMSYKLIRMIQSTDSALGFALL